MARQSVQPRILLDWIAVSYRSVGIGAAVLVAVGIAAAVWWTYFAPVGPQGEAREAIRRATERISEAASYPSDARMDELIGSSRVALDQARAEFNRRSFDDARVAAIRAENLSQKAIDMARGEGTADREVQIFKMEGDVRVKRVGEFSWEPAERNLKLRVGDQIKTAANSSAELIYFDGTKTKVEPGSLLEIRQVFEDPATKVRQVREKLSWGEILASTQKAQVAGSYHEVATEVVTARSEDGATFRVSVDKERRTSAFDALTGTIQVAGSKRREVVAEGERLRAAADGTFEGKQVLPGVPRLIAPSDQRVFVHEDPSEAKTSLSWEPVAGASRYLLVIADKSLFASPRYRGEHQETNVVIDGVPTGEYYWKVAAVSSAGVQGPFSQDRRFRVTADRIRDRGDTTPPALGITDKVQTGSMLILNGRTEPGAALWVDDEKVEVGDDGSFYAVVRLRKEGVNDVKITAQDAAGNTAKLTHRAYVDPL